MFTFERKHGFGKMGIGLLFSLLLLSAPTFCRGENMFRVFGEHPGREPKLFTMAKNDSTLKVRKAAVSGSFYSSSPNELSSQLETWMGDSISASESKIPQAIIVPHAGYVFSGEVAASAFSLLPRDSSYRRIFLIGPSHRVGFPGASVDTLFSAAETPLGEIRIDRELGNELISSGEGVFTFRADAHLMEHCLEVQLPFLQKAFGGEVPPIVPIVIGTERLNILSGIAKALEPYFNRENLFVISSDFSHYPSYEDARKSDLYLAETISSGGLHEFLKALSEIRKMDFPGEDTPACGACAIAVLLSIMDSQGRDNFEVEHLMYRNSGDSPYGDKDGVVGYNSFVVERLENHNDTEKKESMETASEDHLFNFTEDEKKAIISAARSSIFSALEMEGEESVVPEGILKEKGYGVFVTLTLGGHLRGCIGRFISDDTLYSTIRQMALSAAFDDPRFPPLSRSEAMAVEVEVSVLSPLKKIDSIDEFTLGRDGIYMVKGSRHGTFLPQVAEETGWNAEEFLGHCARDKAGIGYWGWKDADLYIYQTEVIKQSDVE